MDSKDKQFLIEFLKAKGRPGKDHYGNEIIYILESCDFSWHDGDPRYFYFAKTNKEAIDTVNA